MKRRTKEKLLISLIIFIILILGITIYLNKVFLPIKVKAILVKNLETALNRKVTLEKLKFNLLKGVVLSGITISDDPALNKESFLKIKEISFGILYLPIFKEKKLIIPSLRIDSAQITLIRTKENLWNFSSLLKTKSDSKSKTKFSFAINKIAIINAEGKFTDLSQQPDFSTSFHNLDITAYLFLPHSVRLNLTGNLKESNLSLKGDFNLVDKSLRLSSMIKNLNFRDYQVYAPPALAFLKNCLIDDAKIDASYRSQSLNINGNINAKNLVLQQKSLGLAGNLNLSGRFNYEPNLAEKINYQGTAQISEECNLSGLPFIDTASINKAKIDFSPSGIKTDNLEAEIQGQPVKISGAIENLKDPNLNLNIRGDFQLAKLKEILSSQFKLENVKVSGKTKLDLNLTGPLKQLAFKGNATILSANLELPDFDPITNIGAQLVFDNQSISWIDLSAQYQDQGFLSSGTIINFEEPEIQAKVSGKTLSLDASVKPKDKILQISKLSGKFYNSDFSLQGNIDRTQIKNPALDLKGNLQLDLKDLKNLSPKLAETIEKNKIDGILNSSLALNGELKNWRAWQVAATATSPSVDIAGLKSGPLNFNYRQQDQTIKNCQLNLKTYGGNINLDMAANLSSEDIPYVLNINAADIDLAKLKLDTAMKDKNLSGFLALSATINGFGKNAFDTAKGRSNLNIKDGNLWELNLLKGLGRFIFIPDFDKIVIRETSGDFVIENKTISTQNLVLKSDQMNLTCMGNVDFSGKIDALINAEFSDQVVENSNDLRKLITSVLGQVSKVLAIKVSGTLKEPKFKPQPVAEQVIDQLKGGAGEAIETLKGVLEGILR